MFYVQKFFNRLRYHLQTSEKLDFEVAHVLLEQKLRFHWSSHFYYWIDILSQNLHVELAPQKQARCCAMWLFEYLSKAVWRSSIYRFKCKGGIMMFLASEPNHNLPAGKLFMFSLVLLQVDFCAYKVLYLRLVELLRSAARYAGFWQITATWLFIEVSLPFFYCSIGLKTEASQLTDKISNRGRNNFHCSLNPDSTLLKTLQAWS